MEESSVSINTDVDNGTMAESLPETNSAVEHEGLDVTFSQPRNTGVEREGHIMAQSTNNPKAMEISTTIVDKNNPDRSKEAQAADKTVDLGSVVEAQQMAQLVHAEASLKNYALFRIQNKRMYEDKMLHELRRKEIREPLDEALMKIELMSGQLERREDVIRKLRKFITVDLLKKTQQQQQPGNNIEDSRSAMTEMSKSEEAVEQELRDRIVEQQRVIDQQNLQLEKFRRTVRFESEKNKQMMKKLDTQDFAHKEALMHAESDKNIYLGMVESRETKLERLMEEKDEMEEELEEARDAADTAKKELKSLKALNQQLEENHKLLTEQRDEYKGKWEERETALENLRAEFEACSVRHDNLRTRYDSIVLELDKMVEEGYYIPSESSHRSADAAAAAAAATAVNGGSTSHQKPHSKSATAPVPDKRRRTTLRDHPLTRRGSTITTGSPSVSAQGSVVSQQSSVAQHTPSHGLDGASIVSNSSAVSSSSSAAAAAGVGASTSKTNKGSVPQAQAQAHHTTRHSIASNKKNSIHSTSHHHSSNANAINPSAAAVETGTGAGAGRVPSPTGVLTGAALDGRASENDGEEDSESDDDDDDDDYRDDDLGIGISDSELLAPSTSGKEHPSRCGTDQTRGTAEAGADRHTQHRRRSTKLPKRIPRFSIRMVQQDNAIEKAIRMSFYEKHGIAAATTSQLTEMQEKFDRLHALRLKEKEEAQKEKEALEVGQLILNNEINRLTKQVMDAKMQAAGLRKEMLDKDLEIDTLKAGAAAAQAVAALGLSTSSQAGNRNGSVSAEVDAGAGDRAREGSSDSADSGGSGSKSGKPLRLSVTQRLSRMNFSRPTTAEIAYGEDGGGNPGNDGNEEDEAAARARSSENRRKITELEAQAKERAQRRDGASDEDDDDDDDDDEGGGRRRQRRTMQFDDDDDSFTSLDDGNGFGHRYDILRHSHDWDNVNMNSKAVQTNYEESATVGSQYERPTDDNGELWEKEQAAQTDAKDMLHPMEYYLENLFRGLVNQSRKAVPQKNIDSMLVDQYYAEGDGAKGRERRLKLPTSAGIPRSPSGSGKAPLGARSGSPGSSQQKGTRGAVDEDIPEEDAGFRIRRAIGYLYQLNQCRNTEALYINHSGATWNAANARMVIRCLDIVLQTMHNILSPAQQRDASQYPELSKAIDIDDEEYYSDIGEDDEEDFFRDRMVRRPAATGGIGGGSLHEASDIMTAKWKDHAKLIMQQGALNDRIFPLTETMLAAESDGVARGILSKYISSDEHKFMSRSHRAKRQCPVDVDSLLDEREEELRSTGRVTSPLERSRPTSPSRASAASSPSPPRSRSRAAGSPPHSRPGSSAARARDPSNKDDRGVESPSAGRSTSPSRRSPDSRSRGGSRGGSSSRDAGTGRSRSPSPANRSLLQRANSFGAGGTGSGTCKGERDRSSPGLRPLLSPYTTGVMTVTVDTVTGHTPRAAAEMPTQNSKTRSGGDLLDADAEQQQPQQGGGAAATVAATVAAAPGKGRYFFGPNDEKKLYLSISTPVASRDEAEAVSEAGAGTSTGAENDIKEFGLTEDERDGDAARVSREETAGGTKLSPVREVGREEFSDVLSPGPSFVAEGSSISRAKGSYDEGDAQAGAEAEVEAKIEVGAGGKNSYEDGGDDDDDGFKISEEERAEIDAVALQGYYNFGVGQQEQTSSPSPRADHLQQQVGGVTFDITSDASSDEEGVRRGPSHSRSNNNSPKRGRNAKSGKGINQLGPVGKIFTNPTLKSPMGKSFAGKFRSALDSGDYVDYTRIPFDKASPESKVSFNFAASSTGGQLALPKIVGSTAMGTSAITGNSAGNNAVGAVGGASTKCSKDIAATTGRAAGAPQAAGELTSGGVGAGTGLSLYTYINLMEGAVGKSNSGDGADKRSAALELLTAEPASRSGAQSSTGGSRSHGHSYAYHHGAGGAGSSGGVRDAHSRANSAVHMPRSRGGRESYGGGLECDINITSTDVIDRAPLKDDAADAAEGEPAAGRESKTSYDDPHGDVVSLPSTPLHPPAPSHVGGISAPAGEGVGEAPDELAMLQDLSILSGSMSGAVSGTVGAIEATASAQGQQSCRAVSSREKGFNAKYPVVMEPTSEQLYHTGAGTDSDAFNASATSGVVHLGHMGISSIGISGREGAVPKPQQPQVSRPTSSTPRSSTHRKVVNPGEHSQRLQHQLPLSHPKSQQQGDLQPNKRGIFPSTAVRDKAKKKHKSNKLSESKIDWSNPTYKPPPDDGFTQMLAQAINASASATPAAAAAIFQQQQRSQVHAAIHPPGAGIVTGSFRKEPANKKQSIGSVGGAGGKTGAGHAQQMHGEQAVELLLSLSARKSQPMYPPNAPTWNSGSYQPYHSDQHQPYHSDQQQLLEQELLSTTTPNVVPSSGAFSSQPSIVDDDGGGIGGGSAEMLGGSVLLLGGTGRKLRGVKQQHEQYIRSSHKGPLIQSSQSTAAGTGTGAGVGSSYLLRTDPDACAAQIGEESDSSYYHRRHPPGPHDSNASGNTAVTVTAGAGTGAGVVADSTNVAYTTYEYEGGGAKAAAAARTGQRPSSAALTLPKPCMQQRTSNRIDLAREKSERTGTGLGMSVGISDEGALSHLSMESSCALSTAGATAGATSAAGLAGVEQQGSTELQLGSPNGKITRKHTDGAVLPATTRAAAKTTKSTAGVSGEGGGGGGGGNTDAKFLIQGVKRQLQNGSPVQRVQHY